MNDGRRSRGQRGRVILRKNLSGRYLYPLFEVPAGGWNPMVQAYCVKCKAKREMKDPVAVTLKNGKPATKGTCPVCGTTIMRIGAAT